MSVPSGVGPRVGGVPEGQLGGHLDLKGPVALEVEPVAVEHQRTEKVLAVRASH